MTNTTQHTGNKVDHPQLVDGKVRESYYNSYCYLRNLQEFALDVRDKRLHDEVRFALQHVDNIYKRLESTYKWD